MKNYKLKEFFKLPYYEQLHYYYALKFVKPVGKIGVYKRDSIRELSYSNVINLKKRIKDNDIEACFNIVFGISKDELMECDVKQYFPAFNFISHQIDELITIEKDWLTSSPNNKLKQAGIDDFNILQEMGVLIPIAKEFSCDPDVIAEWTYNKVFSILLYNKIESDVNKRLSEQTE